MQDDSVEIFKALGNEIRFEIVKLLLGKKELSCQDLQKHFSLSQPTMSHHFSDLVKTGIIKARKEGANHYYRIDLNFLAKHGIYFKGGEKQ